MADIYDGPVRPTADSAADWTSIDPVLKAAEIGIETDTLKVKIGDGVTAWTGLPYASEPPTAASRAIAALTPADNQFPYFTSTTAAAMAAVTSYARTLLDDADAVTMRNTLGLGTMAVQNVAAFVPSAGNKVINDRTTVTGAAATQYIFSALNSDAAGYGLLVQAGSGASGRSVRVADSAGTVLFEITADGHVRCTGLPTYADNAAADAAGLATNKLFKTATGELRIRV